MNQPKENPNKEISPEEERLALASFRLPEDLINRVDDLWLSMRKSDRKLKKYHLVKDLLEAGLREYKTKKKLA